MSTRLPLPESMQSKVAANTHPGLALDKYMASWDPDAREGGKLQENVQKPAIEKVVHLSQGPPDADLFKRLVERRRGVLQSLNAQVFTCRATGPLTLHLSRASALENAGLCMHPVYGFAYLPGSGLKGLARAYAESLWLPTQPEGANALVSRVFGSSAYADGDSAGSVVFHDAWPESWPKLGLDIVNNHHPGYYEGRNEPGDWEDPIPVYFLSVTAGARFQFALSLRRSDSDAALIETARQWLEGALITLGAGAKTNAGYGAFERAEGTPVSTQSSSIAQCDVEVELVTPGFFAGPLQGAEDCNLRSATLRGLLRWWWRTLHSDALDAEDLRRLEALIWGDTKRGGAVRIIVEAKEGVAALAYDYRDKYDLKAEFKRANGLRDRPPAQTTPGLLYLSYGMNEAKRPPRWYVQPGARWTIRLAARPASLDKRGVVPAEAILAQAKAALWLLCQFGGAGSKGRKGFGSLQVRSDMGTEGLDGFKTAAKSLRASLVLGSGTPREFKSPSLAAVIQQVLPTPWTNYWFALDQVGYAFQAFTQRYKHKPAKLALGLPRKIHGPLREPMRHQTPAGHRPPENLRVGKITRHASPVHLHFRRGAGGKLELVVSAFPSALLPDFKENQRFLQEFVQCLAGEISDRARGNSEGRNPVASNHGASVLGSKPNLPRAGELVEAVLLEEKTKKGGWKAKHELSGLSGAVVNHEIVQRDAQPGDRLTLTVKSINEKMIEFKVPTAAELAAPVKPRPAGVSKSQGYSSGGPDKSRRGPR